MTPVDDLGGPKIEYVMPNGFKSTAYLDDDSEDEFRTGVNKHTDEPATVRWTGERWEQVS